MKAYGILNILFSLKINSMEENLPKKYLQNIKRIFLMENVKKCLLDHKKCLDT